MAEKDTKKEGVEDKEIKKMQITFSSCQFNKIQQVTNQFLGNAKAGVQSGEVKLIGPVRLPNKHLRICCRRSPCGEGSKTWDNYEMTIYKRFIILECTSTQMKEINSLTIPSGVEIRADLFNQ